MRPPILTTERGQKWLSQFDPEDQPLAKELVGLLLLVGRDEFELGVVQTLNELYDGEPGPIALFACREIGEGENYFDADFPLKPVRSQSGIGSEGDFAHLIRDFCKADKRFLDHPTIAKMRERKVRAICVLDDFIASGNRSREFVEALYIDKTIKSWISFGWTRIHCLAHSGTDFGIKHLLAGKSHWNVAVTTISSSFECQVGAAKASDLKGLCRKYSVRGRIPKNWILGYKDACTSIVFAHKCPNTAPGILWYSNKKSWLPLFNPRASFGYPVWPVALSQRQLVASRLLSVGQPKLSQLKWLETLGEHAVHKILLLAFVGKGYRRTVRIAEQMQVSITHIESLVSGFKELGWITPSGRLSSEGLAILKKAKELGLETREWQFSVDPDAFYFMHNS